ncbi:MAG TPA: DUF2141 domain-containing protein [Bryobacteraceae bacterium]|jgi:uncharacterized protein (DUF2141 family)|nr:DUF2141 domain-containing protein [Bryobacteraceae bacterium]
MHPQIRTVALVLAAIVGPAAAAAPATGNCTLVIHVTGFRNQKGVAGGTLFTSPDGWPEDNDKSFRHGPFPIAGDHATLTFDRLPPGRYGVAVLHDENSNHKLDRNFLRVPKEGFGFANNPHVGLSAPKWEDSTVNVACPVTEINIRLIYK